MTRTYDPAVSERDANMWPLLAATILGVQGLGKLVFAAFLPAPVSGAGIDIPVLGTMPFIWIAVGVVSLVAGAAVAARLWWGRYLGVFSAVIAIAAGVFDAQGVSSGTLAFILPGVVIFALWQKWPADRSIHAAPANAWPEPAPAPSQASPDLRARPKDQAA
jgi:hypothetical protein